MFRINITLFFCFLLSTKGQFAVAEHGANQRRRSAIRWSDLLAMRFKSFVERDCALRVMSIESEGEEYLLWHSLMHKTRHVPEPEFSVVIRMPH